MASKISLVSRASSWGNFQSLPALSIQWSGPRESEPSSHSAKMMAAMGPRLWFQRQWAGTLSSRK
eukprot:9295469-Pyramimonas_sp.AAC.1